jgi:hypothetical protein
MEMKIAAEMSLRRRQHDRLLLGVANRDRQALKAAFFGSSVPGGADGRKQVAASHALRFGMNGRR